MVVMAAAALDTVTAIAKLDNKLFSGSIIDDGDFVHDEGIIGSAAPFPAPSIIFYILHPVHNANACDRHGLFDSSVRPR